MKQQWQHTEIHRLLTKCPLREQEKLHLLMFEREQGQHVENPIHCLVHYSDKMEKHPLIFERGQWQHVENHTHCLVKQQWQHMKIIHCLLNVKSDVTTNGKQHPLFFEREYWQLVENHIYCLVKQQWQHIEIHPLLAKCACTRKIASTDFWKSVVTECGKSDTLLSSLQWQEENHPLLI